MLRIARPLIAVLALSGSMHLGRPGGPPVAAVGTADPADPALYTAPPGERLAFGVREGDLRNYFHRQGPAAVHLLTRSGREPRIIAAFPAGNQGIGVWFTPQETGAQLWAGEKAGAGDDAAVAAGGGLVGVSRQDGARELHGVRATLRSDAPRLTAQLVLLANVRTLRDYGYGTCLENANQYPALRNETLTPVEGQNEVRVRRVQIGGDHAMELIVKGRPGTRVTVEEQRLPARPACQATSAGDTRKVIALSGDRGLAFDLIALSDEQPLTPIEKDDLLTVRPADNFAFDALAFLSYREKLEAGTWRFLTYFGRDTLLSVRMLMPGLERDVVEAALSAVLERVNLVPGLPDPSFDFRVEPGEVAHEEELADFAAWKNFQQDPPPADLRAPRYDYKMVDDDFLLAPALVDYLDRLRAEADEPAARSRFEAFLARTRPDGATFRQAIEANLALVLERARPFAEDPAPAVEKVRKLVSLKDTVPVGNWRDSDMGLAFGRYPFDVNVALLPAALEAARALYAELGRTAEAAQAGAYREKWRGVEQLFLIEVPAERIQANVADYAASTGIADTSAEIQAEPDGRFRFYGIALDAAGRPLPVVHTDHGFAMEYTEPGDAYLLRVARTLTQDFPAGLRSPVGMMVANPALASPGLTVTDQKDLRDPADDQQVLLRDLFTSSQYHGAVVWSWQQALLASGLRRQLERTDLQAGTRAALQVAECRVWEVIAATRDAASGELWSWAPGAQGRPEYRPFGFNVADVDESNAAQLWSTVYLVVKPPPPHQNERCSRAPAGRAAGRAAGPPRPAGSPGAGPASRTTQ